MIIVHPACGEIPPTRQARLERLAADLPRGRTMPYRSARANYWLARDKFGRLLVSMARDESFPKRAPSAAPDAAVWGTPFWKEIHSAALTMTAAEWQAYVATIAPRLPCCGCRGHFLSLLERLPAASDDQFARSVEWHNAVNVAKPSPSPTMTLSEARALYEK